MSVSAASILALLALLLTALSLNVSRLRMRHRVSFGDGGHRDLMVAVRAHGNALEQSLLFGLLLLLLLAALPRFLRGRRRRARLADMANASLSPQDRANAAWDELEDLSVDHGGSPKESDTPRVRARRMAAGIPAASEAVDRIVSDVEHASYAAPDASWKPSASAADLGKVHDELMHRASGGQKFRATWWPASIFRR